MDAFEAARVKHAKNKERRERSAANTVTVPYAIDPGDPVEIPMERPLADAVIEVTIRLPSGPIGFRFIKKEVLSNVPNHRLTRNEFRKVLVEGLVPLLGRIDEA